MVSVRAINSRPAFSSISLSSTGEDESSDIRIPVHGTSLKLRNDSDGTIAVQPHLAVYVRVLPAWEDLDNDVLGLRPKPRLAPHVRQEVNAEAFVAAEAARVAGDRRSRKVIFAETARRLLTQRGVRFAGTEETVVTVNPEEEPQLGGEPRVRRPARNSEKTAGEETPVEVAETTDGAVYPDDLCSSEDIPMKFRRLTVAVPPLVLALQSDVGERDRTIREHAVQMSGAVAKAYDDFMRSPDGIQWCWRKKRLPPSAFRSQRSWEAALATIRLTPINRAHLCPDQNVEIAVEWATSPADDRVVHAAIGLMHRTCGAVGDQDGDGGLYQVRLDLDVRPATALIPYVLERVKPALRHPGIPLDSRSGLERRRRTDAAGGRHPAHHDMDAPIHSAAHRSQPNRPTGDRLRSTSRSKQAHRSARPGTGGFRTLGRRSAQRGESHLGTRHR
ncbi:hypothetical protein ACVWW4_003511 [Bradyrhizobium sp. LB7.1]